MTHLNDEALVTEQSAAADPIEKKGSFTLVISGGSIIKALAQLAADSKASDFSKWHVAWADERNVALSNPDSNFKVGILSIALQHPFSPNFHLHNPNMDPFLTVPVSSTQQQTLAA